MSALTNVKLLLGIDVNSVDKDDLLNLLISKATDNVKNICSFKDADVIPTTLNSVIEDIAVWKYQNKGKENKKSETIGHKSADFLEGIPSAIMDQIKPFRKIRVL